MRHCPHCHCGSHVTDTRETDTTVKRRRKCRKCGWTWTTYEAVFNSEHEIKRLLKQAAKLKQTVEKLHKASLRHGAAGE